MNIIEPLIRRNYHIASSDASVESLDSILKDSYAVLFEEGHYKGVLTQEDVFRKRHKLAIDCLVEKPQLKLDDTIAHALDMFRGSHSSALPVFLKNEFTGVLNKSDLLHEIYVNEQLLEELVKVRTIELREMSHSLADKVKKRTKELIIAKEEADNANMAKTTFIAQVSHEIRTPLSSIIGITELLESSELSLRHKEYIDLLHDCAEALKITVSGIIDITAIEENKLILNPEAFNLKSLCSDIERAFKYKFADKGLSFSATYDPIISDMIVSDKNRLLQIIRNLFSNAVKYTDSGSVKFSIQLDLIDDVSYVLFRVVDTGIGIEETKKPKLFKKFGRLHLDRAGESIGIGLSFCKTLVDALHGKIWHDDNPGGGSIFAFRVPLIIPDEKFDPCEDTFTKEAGNRDNLNILVVEDDPLSRKVISWILEKMGHSVIMAESGLKALEEVAKNKPDVVFMDCNMTEMDGFETTEKIRSLGNNILIIACTGNVMVDDIQKCYKAGMNDYLLKPVTSAAIDLCLKNIKRSSSSYH
ncbi:MAG: response regulator [Bacteroidales bacterium]|nr:response regulator [Bacteroidales bacterium]MCF8402714.1 response regulator [Bacteroidales bacterium]